MTAAARIAEPLPEARAAIDAIRVEWIGETADLAIPFLVGAREAARNGDIDRLGDCLRALWLAAQTMRRAYREIGGCSDPETAP
jgi:hypothetical protein